MCQRTIAIGDVHGCARALDALLREIQPTEDDRIVTLGDYVDRGPDSRQVIERLIALGQECRLVTLMGNHEIMLLTALDDEHEREFWLSCGGSQTVDSYGGSLSSIPEAHIQFMDNCRSSFETSSHIFLHANYQPDVPLEKQNAYSLFWKHLTLDIPKAHKSGKTVVVGHTPQADGEVLDLGHLLCLDTFCVGGGWLTAREVDTGQTWQADQDGNLRKN